MYLDTHLDTLLQRLLARDPPKPVQTPDDDATAARAETAAWQAYPDRLQARAQRLVCETVGLQVRHAQANQTPRAKHHVVIPTSIPPR